MEERENYMITYGSTTLTSYNTITKIEVYYYKSTSATSLSGGSWSTTKPTWENGKYIWQKIRTVYEGKLDNGSYYSESDPVNITGQQGATGTAAYSYKLNSSDSIIGKTKDGEYTIKKITFSATYKQGTGAISAYGGRFKIESTTNGSTWKTEYTSSENEASKEFTIPNDIIAIKCSLYQSSGTTVLLDIVTVPVVKDGVDAIGLRDSIPYYLASDKDTGITRLTQGWTRYRPQLTAEKKYLWVYYVSRYSEGTTEPELIEIKDDLVHFVNNGDESPVESCVVDIEPVQDLHGYDSPWPAGGGKNLVDTRNLDVTVAGIHCVSDSDGVISLSGTRDSSTGWRTLTVFTDFAPGNYVFSSNNQHVTCLLNWTRKPGTFTVAEGDIVRIALFNIVAGDTLNDTGIKVQIESGSTATDWTPYSNICPITGWTGCIISHSGADTSNPTTYPITFPSEAGTVYGGYVDVTGGELVVDRAQIASYNGETLPSTWISDRDVYSAGATPTTGAQVVYELATPITYTLTPQEITMLCKENNIFADTGQTSISYYDNQTSTDPYVDYSATSAFEYANTAINRATAVYGTCSTAADTPLKEVVCENFILFDGVRIQVAFEKANSTNVPSLNVNNTGAKQILINQAIVSESNQLLWAENAQMEFVYDGTYWVLQNAPYSLYGICSVTEEIPEKVIECAETVICKGTTITVDFMYSNTSDNTVFNVANIAQKPLLVNGDVLKVNSRFNWHAGAIRTFYFDGQAWNMSDDIVSAYIDEYETEQDEDGIMVHPVGQKNTGWSIGSTLELLKNGVSYIKMWFDKVEEGEFSLPFIRIGKESGNHVLVGDDAVTIREDQKELAHYSSLGITFDDETPYKIGNDTTYIAFEDTDNDAKADSLRIVADSISFHSNGTEKDLRSELEGLNENIDLNAQAIEQNAEAIENTQKYIQIDPEVPSIKLATNDRNYLLIESNKLGFWVDANETAYMSQNQMNIPTASITNLLMQTTNAKTGETIGQIGWVMRTNGHLSLKIMN